MRAVAPTSRAGGDRPLGLAVTLAREILAFGEPLATGHGAARAVLVDDLLTRLASVRDVGKEKLDAILATFADVGLVSLAGSGAQRKLPVAELQGVGAFLDLMLVWHDEPLLRERWLSVDDAEAAALTSMIEVAKYHGAKPGVDFETTLAEVRGENAVELARRALAKAEDLGFAKVATFGDDAKVWVKALSLQHALRSLAAIRALSRMPTAKPPEEPVKVLTESF